MRVSKARRRKEMPEEEMNRMRVRRVERETEEGGEKRTFQKSLEFRSRKRYVDL